VAAVLLATLAGCTGPLPRVPGPQTSSVDANDTFAPQTTTTPTPGPGPGPQPTDENGPQPADNGDHTDPYLAVPTLPPGGNEDFPTGLAAGVHCVQVNYLANDAAPIPSGVRLVVTSVNLAAGGKYFTVGGSGCTQPLCTDGFAWSHGDETCYVALTEKTGWSGEQDARISMSGKADCRAVTRAVCADYVAKVRKQATTIDLTLDATQTQTTTTQETTAPETTTPDTTTQAPTETTTTADDVPTTTTSAGA
jgi:hypothetical protein